MELQKIEQEAIKKFEKKFNQNAEFFSFAPGRINIIGEHTDYNLGMSMPAAINRWVVVVLAFRPDALIRVVSDNFASEMKYVPGQSFVATESWMKFVQGAIELFQEEHAIDKGFNAYIWGNVPLGAGVSSSAATEVSLLNMLRTAFQKPMTDLELVKKGQKIEHQYVGVKSGLLDQYASQFSKAGKLMLLDFNSLTHTYADADMGDWCWVLANTKVKRELAGSKYPERVLETQKALETVKHINKNVQNFRDVTMNDISVISDNVLKKRMEHYVSENQRVFDLAKAFESKDIHQVGSLLLKSHESLQNLYEVSCAELDFLVNKAIAFAGCAGARMMGGGFGGCTLNLILKTKLQEFSEYILEAYKQEFGIVSETYAFDVVDGASAKVL